MPAPSSLRTAALTHSTAMPLVFSQIKVTHCVPGFNLDMMLIGVQMLSCICVYAYISCMC